MWVVCLVTDLCKTYQRGAQILKPSFLASLPNLKSPSQRLLPKDPGGAVASRHPRRYSPSYQVCN